MVLKIIIIVLEKSASKPDNRRPQTTVSIFTQNVIKIDIKTNNFFRLIREHRVRMARSAQAQALR